MEPKLKVGDIISAKKTVAIINMTIGDHYKVVSLKQDYHEPRYFLKRCDETGVVQRGKTLELAIESLDFWIEDGSIQKV